jgi:hypothetical protein
MAKRTSRSAPAFPGLFDGDMLSAPAPLRVPVETSGLSSQQARRARLVADSLRRDIVRFQGQLAAPLTSWDEYNHQQIEANTALVFVLSSVAEFLPDDLRSLVAEFIDLRSQVVLRGGI